MQYGWCSDVPRVHVLRRAPFDYDVRSVQHQTTLDIPSNQNGYPLRSPPLTLQWNGLAQSRSQGLRPEAFTNRTVVHHCVPSPRRVARTRLTRSMECLEHISAPLLLYRDSTSATPRVFGVVMQHKTHFQDARTLTRQCSGHTHSLNLPPSSSFLV